MEWDTETNRKTKSIDFIGGEDLTAFKAFVASLPDNLAPNQTAKIEIELITNV